MTSLGIAMTLATSGTSKAPTLLEQFTNWRANLSELDYIIVGLGTVLIVLHLFVVISAVAVRRPRTHQRLVMFLGFGSFGTELLPLLGILGTVLPMLFTLTNLGNSATFDVRDVARDFAPALSTTVSGLVFAIINLALNGMGLMMLKEDVGKLG